MNTKQITSLNDIDFSEFPVTEVKNLLARAREFVAENKEEIKEMAKIEREKAREEARKVGQSYCKSVGVGNEITVEYHGKEFTGTITKIKDNGKTFNLDVVEDGETKNIWRYFEQIVLPSDYSSDEDEDEIEDFQE